MTTRTERLRALHAAAEVANPVRASDALLLACVAAHNAMPAALDVIEAAKRFLACADRRTEEADALRAALARWEVPGE